MWIVAIHFAILTICQRQRAATAVWAISTGIIICARPPIGMDTRKIPPKNAIFSQRKKNSQQALQQQVVAWCFWRWAISAGIMDRGRAHMEFWKNKAVTRNIPYTPTYSLIKKNFEARIFMSLNSASQINILPHLQDIFPLGAKDVMYSTNKPS